MKVLVFIFAALLSMSGLRSQKIVNLWGDNPVPNQRESVEKEIRTLRVEDGRPDILWIENVQRPTLEIYLPSPRHATGQAVVILPGVGYRGLAYDWEGTDVAKWLNSRGIAAFVLKYRLPFSESLIIPHQAPLMDAQRAVKWVRSKSAEWNIDPSKIGVMGFSAGGHLAATLGNRFGENLVNRDSIDAISARPDFMVLVYPVITFQPDNGSFVSRTNLIGEKPGPGLIEYYSNERHVHSGTPPTFLVHSGDDPVVPPGHSLAFYQALQQQGIAAEMHLYPCGGHGYGLALGRGRLELWPQLLAEWLKSL
jgi:acetyl esterase/lipase